jgi:ABC-2 type transport system permease protein
MSWLAHELRLLLRSKLAVAAFVLLTVLSVLAVLSGMREVERQRQTIARLAVLQQQDLAAQARKYVDGAEAGSAAYYTFHATWDAPSPTAFLALGLRDAAPYVLRVRALALQAQVHEGESFNPELALAGRFDFAFVLVYLAPLFLIALLYDLVSGERRSGRLGTLLALPGAGRGLWLRRAGLRATLVFGCLVLPALAGALASGSPAVAIGTVLLVTAGYLATWSGLALIVATRNGSSAANAMALMGCWAVLTLILPTLANAVLARAVPVHQGVALMLAQRQTVHGAWDLPPEATMAKFFQTHPQWRDTAPLPEGFHWKWYYAFQQLGDESVAPQVAAYRAGLQSRQGWTARLGWLLPGVGVQAALHRQAGTDLQAQLAYQQRITDFHTRLRDFYYPYLFNEVRFGSADFAAQPRFSASAPSAKTPVGSLLALLLVGAGALVLGAVAAGRVRLVRGASSTR